MGVAGWGWDERNVAGKVVRNVAPVCFRGPGRLSRRNDVAYPPAAFRLHPALPAIPRRPSPQRPRLASRDQARRLPHDGAARRRRHAAAHPQRDRLLHDRIESRASTASANRFGKHPVQREFEAERAALRRELAAAREELHRSPPVRRWARDRARPTQPLQLTPNRRVTWQATSDGENS
jgi:hypothetical protein